MALNLCQFMGNLGRDPELKHMPDGREVVSFSVGCSERWKDKNTGEQIVQTEWVRAACFGARAAAIAKFFKKGSQIYISGKMRTRSYEKDGTTVYATEIIVDDFQFCGKSGEQSVSGQTSIDHPAKSAQQSSNYDDFDDDIPF